MNHISNFSKNKSKVKRPHAGLTNDQCKHFVICNWRSEKKRAYNVRRTKGRQRKKRNSQHNYLLYVPNYNMPMLTLPFHILPGGKIGKVKYVLTRACVWRSQTSQFPFNLLLASVAGSRRLIFNNRQHNGFTLNSLKHASNINKTIQNLWCLFDSSKYIRSLTPASFIVNCNNLIDVFMHFRIWCALLFIRYRSFSHSLSSCAFCIGAEQRKKTILIYVHSSIQG